MVDEILEIGTDINSSWEFEDGDLKIVKQNENICQTIKNRLNTSYGTYDLYYGEYGSFLMKFLGWKRNEETLKFIEMEIINTLKQDVRLQNINVTLSYGDEGVINGNINIHFDEDTDLSLSLVLTNLGIEVGVDDGD